MMQTLIHMLKLTWDWTTQATGMILCTAAHTLRHVAEVRIAALGTAVCQVGQAFVQERN